MALQDLLSPTPKKDSQLLKLKVREHFDGEEAGLTLTEEISRVPLNNGPTRSRRDFSTSPNETVNYGNTTIESERAL